MKNRSEVCLAHNEIDDGYIKFNLKQTFGEPLADEFLTELIRYRQKLYALQLIGVYHSGVGYGNISQRTIENQFVISGSATGSRETVTTQDFCTVTECSIKTNTVEAEGPIDASSESMTHFVLYTLDQSINAVIHVHSLSLWKKLCGVVPTTGKDIPYGTPEMAYAVENLYNNSSMSEKKILAMEGHEEGIVVFGNSLDDAFITLMSNL
ncbi:MAG: class II aldolase/adducin family protein [Fibrobacterales bacterium]